MLFLLSLVVFGLSSFPLKRPDLPEPVGKSVNLAAGSFHSVNGYGLFRRMTTERPEIIIEGSNDGVTWVPYEFYWKPGDLSRRPGLVAPHQPRLDWQMWFAALNGRYQRSSRLIWFERLIVRIFEGEPEVMKFFAVNPFPERPPNYLRARLYRYEFTTAAEKKETGNWWNRELIGEFFPVVSRQNLRR